MKRLSAPLLALTLAVGCATAHAQPPNGSVEAAPLTGTTAASEQVIRGSDAVSPVLAFATQDLQNALTIYKTAGDAQGTLCIQAILDAQPQLSALTAMPVTGAFSAFAAARVRTEALKKGIPEAVHVACAPLVIDAQAVLLRFH